MHLRYRLLQLIESIPLQAIFIVPFVVQVVLAVGIIGFISYHNGQKAVDTLVVELQDEIALRIEERLHQYLQTPHMLNKIQAHTIEAGQLDLASTDPDLLSAYFWQNLLLFEELNATFLGTADGLMVGARRLTNEGVQVMLASEETGQNLNYYVPDAQGHPGQFVTGAPDYDPRARSWYEEAERAGQPHWSPIYLDFATGMLVITAGQPVYSADNQLLGVLGSAFQFEQVNDFLQGLDIGQNGQTFIMDRDGLLVTTSTDAPLAIDTAEGLVRRPAVASENSVEQNTAVFLRQQFGGWENIQQTADLTVDINDQPYYVRVTPITDAYGLDWLVVVMIPAADFMGQIQANNRITLIVVTIALLWAILIGIATTRWITQPLRDLRDAAVAFSEGDWSERVQTNRRDELGALANTFNEMAGQLQDSFTTINESRRRFQSMFNYVPIMLLEIDLSGVRRYLEELPPDKSADLAHYLMTSSEALIACVKNIQILAVNEQTRRVMGGDEQDLLATIERFGSPEMFSAFGQQIVALWAGQTEFEAETMLTTAERRQIQVYVRMALVPGHEENWSRALVSLQDITQRTRMEMALRQSERRLKRAQHMARLGDWEFELDTGQISWSEEVFRLFGRPLVDGPPTYEELMTYYMPEGQARLQEQVDTAVSTGEQSAESYRIRRLSGEIVHLANTMYPVVDTHGRVIKLTGTVQDVSERILLEQQVQNQERLAAVGQLAAGIAHDFNNILSSITLYTDLLLRNLSDLSAKNKRRLEIVSNQTERASRLIQQILDFSRQSPLERMPTNVLLALRELIELLQRTLPENIRLQFVHDRSTYVADIDLTRFQQAIMNLAVNARDAMPDGGILTFTVVTETLTAEDVPPVANMPPGEWVKIDVSDTGLGVAPDDLPRLFEPFFTTKATGKGTGLGLAQVYGVVTQLDGFITVASQLGEGTTFTIYLPLLAEIPTEFVGWTTAGAEMGQNETVLIVEDDVSTREALVSALEALNYDVQIAAHGREALALLANDHDGAIELIVSDMLMPEMSGLDLVRELRARDLDLPVVILSGYLLEDDLDTLHALQVVGWLNKPPKLNQLAALIRQGLDASNDETEPE